ncbi:hypothetical protein Nepgr_005224 [Nepenthes gracilis]|uniref:Uncharacterized protein n=1 Tax=Nepenthes gracilis TaxID=150966 RepID=A0AAD3S2S0_NEPGR|nr:hypothetical protein Nepgr_005224 [Nepenthes gracilis]
MQDQIHHATTPPHLADELGTNQHTPDYKSNSLPTSWDQRQDTIFSRHLQCAQSPSRPTNISKGKGYQVHGIIPFFTMQQNGSTPPTPSTAEPQVQIQSNSFAAMATHYLNEERSNKSP